MTTTTSSPGPFAWTVAASTAASSISSRLMLYAQITTDTEHVVLSRNSTFETGDEDMITPARSNRTSIFASAVLRHGAELCTSWRTNLLVARWTGRLWTGPTPRRRFGCIVRDRREAVVRQRSKNRRDRKSTRLNSSH